MLGDNKEELETGIFVCKMCGIVANDCDHLKRHVEKEHVGQPYMECDVCGFSTNSDATLNEHVVRQHISNRMKRNQRSVLKPKMAKTNYETAPALPVGPQKVMLDLRPSFRPPSPPGLPWSSVDMGFLEEVEEGVNKVPLIVNNDPLKINNDPLKVNNEPLEAPPETIVKPERAKGRPPRSTGGRSTMRCSCQNCTDWRAADSSQGEIKGHNCAQCGKVYKKWEHYKSHMMNHEGLRPFGCSDCPKAFVRQEDLRRHTAGMHEKGIGR